MNLNIQELTEHYESQHLGFLVEDLDQAIANLNYFIIGVLKDIRDGTIPNAETMDTIICAHIDNVAKITALQRAIEHKWEESREK